MHPQTHHHKSSAAGGGGGGHAHRVGGQAGRFITATGARPSSNQSDRDYKTIKEEWISGQTGSSIHDVNLLGLTMLTTYLLWAVIRNRQLTTRELSTIDNPIMKALTIRLRKLSDFQLELVILILPIVFAHTVLADHLLLLNTAFIAIAAWIYLSTSPTEEQLGWKPLSHIDAKSGRKLHWSKKHSDDSDSDDDDRVNEKDGRPSDHDNQQWDQNVRVNTDPPIRVSIDSTSGDTAAAHPTQFYSDSEDLTSSNASASHFHLEPRTISTNSVSGGGGGGDSLLPTDMGTSNRSSLDSPNSRPLSPGSHVGSGTTPSPSPISPLARSVVDPWSLPIIQRRIQQQQQRQQQQQQQQQKQQHQQHQQPQHQHLQSRTSFNLPPTGSMYIRRQPFLTVYRAHMMVLTVICILAVDFPIFPRRFAKCETWGTSWMDLGVGSFVFSLGVISALPFVRTPQNRFRSIRRQLVTDLRKSSPLIALGLIRVVMVKGVDYPEHVSEYGVHWNFFFTLAILPLSATLARRLGRWIRFSVLGLTISIVHQLLLSQTGWQQWAISDTLARTTLVSANKEGLSSLPGYVAIFFIALDLGHYLLPLDPYYAYRRLRRTRTIPKTDKLAMILTSLVILYSCFFIISYFWITKPSRRLANLSYVLWISCFNIGFLLGYVLVYLFLLHPASSFTVPLLFTDINTFSLLIFLFSNLLTGLINLSIQSMYTSSFSALFIILSYLFILCLVATVLSKNKIKIPLLT